MMDQLIGVLAFALLFGVFGIYGLMRPDRSCGGTCGSCSGSDSCASREQH